MKHRHHHRDDPQQHPDLLATVHEWVQAARLAVPDLQAVLVPHCHGHRWLVDHRDRTIYLPRHLDPAAVVEATREAVAEALRGTHPAPLQLVPGGL